VRSSALCVVCRVISVLTLVFLGLSFSFGQEQAKIMADKGAINGRVTDQTQAVVAGAKVTLANDAGDKLETQVNDKAHIPSPE